MHRDSNGIDRVHTDPSGGTGATFAFLPFGDGGVVTTIESYSDWDFRSYGDMDYNAESGTSHALFRQFNPMPGRWMSPDPYAGSYDFSNPQSLNRYSYVANNPLSFVDPLGTEIRATEVTNRRYHR